MNEFITWASILTFGGAVTLTTILTQFTKGLPFVKGIPTQYWSYILALISIVCAHAFTGGITLNVLAQSVFNAAIVSLASNGTYAGINALTGNSTSGDLLVDTSGVKDLYRLDVGSIDGLTAKKKVTLKVKEGKIYN